MLSTTANNSESALSHQPPHLIFKDAVDQGMKQTFQQYPHATPPPEVQLTAYLTTTLTTLLRTERLDSTPDNERIVVPENNMFFQEGSLPDKIRKATRRGDSLLFASMHYEGEPWMQIVEESGKSFMIAAAVSRINDKPSVLLHYLGNEIIYVAIGLRTVAEILNIARPARLYTETALKLVTDF